MKLQIIACDHDLLHSLQLAARHQGAEVLGDVHRPPEQPLAPLLHRRDVQVLLLELSPHQRNEDLAAVASLRSKMPALQVLVLSEDGAPELLRQAMRAGVCEVLPLPLQPAELAQALQRLLPAGAAAGTTPGPVAPVVTVIGAKGGCGASLLASQLAWVVSQTFGLRSVLIDLDLQCGDASFYAGDGAYTHSVVDAAQAFERLDAALLASFLQPLAAGLHLLAAPADPAQNLRVLPAHLERMLALLQASHDLVLIDIARQLDALALKALDLADRICLVTEPSTHGLRDARRLLLVLRSLGYPDERICLVINRHRSPGAVDDASLQDMLGLRIAHRLPAQPALVDEAIGTGQPLVRLQPQAALTQALVGVAADLLHQPLPQPRGWLARLIGQPA